jgi:SAM-dependent methyltransferase
MSRGRLFAQVADLYDEVRPDYPDEIYDVLAAQTEGLAGLAVLDLAAGTGLATRALSARGAAVVATDIAEGMLTTLRRRTPSVPVAVARAEHLPFGAGVFDLVVCATAWHWVETGPAVHEVLRVLRPGGHLALWWANHRHGDGVEWEDAQSAVFERWARDHDRSRRMPHLGVEPPDAARDLRDRGVEVVVDTEINWQRTVTREQHLHVLRTHSNNLVLGDGAEKVLAEIEAVLQPWPLIRERLHGAFVVARVP